MSEYDALRKVINHEANQDDDGGFFARLGGLEPDPEDDGPTARGLFQHWDAERDGPAFKWPARGGVPPGYFNRNSYVYQYEPEIMPKKSAIDYLIEAFKDAFTAPFKPKRQPITKVRRIWRGPNPITGRTFSTWYWQCALCDHNMRARDTGSAHYGELCFTWETTYRRANHHAHNHHRSQK